VPLHFPTHGFHYALGAGQSTAVAFVPSEGNGRQVSSSVSNRLGASERVIRWFVAKAYRQHPAKSRCCLWYIGAACMRAHGGLLQCCGTLAQAVSGPFSRPPKETLIMQGQRRLEPKYDGFTHGTCKSAQGSFQAPFTISRSQDSLLRCH